MSGTFYIDAATVPLRSRRPLLIVDADEVLLRFADGFDRFLRQRELFLDLTSYRLHGNVKRQHRAAQECLAALRRARQRRRAGRLPRKGV